MGSIFPTLFTASLTFSTYLCAHDLSHPRYPSRTPVILALTGLLGLNFFWLLGILPFFLRCLCGIKIEDVVSQSNRAAVLLVGSTLFFFFLGWCAFAGTYFGIRALATGYSMGVIVAMFPLCVMDVLLVCFYIERVCAFVGWWRAPGVRAKRRWMAVGARSGVGAGREVAMARLERDIRRAEEV